MLRFSSYIYLDEARISPEALAQIHPTINTEHDLNAQHKKSSDIINHFANNADPTNEKIYTPWLVNKYKAGTFTQDQAPQIKQSLSDFHANKSRMPIKDINQYKSPDELNQAVTPFIGSKSGKQQKKDAGDGADLIHAENGVTVHKLNTKEASCKYGAGTKWCTSGAKRNQFDNYNKDGDLYVINKNGVKHQLFLSNNGEERDNELRDAEDKEVPIQDLIKKHPELKNVEEFKNSKLELNKEITFFKKDFPLISKDIDVAKGQIQYIKRWLKVIDDNQKILGTSTDQDELDAAEYQINVAQKKLYLLQ